MVTTLPSVFNPQVDSGQFGDTGSGFGGFAPFGVIFALISLAIVVVVVLMIVRGIKEATSPRIEGSGRVVAKRIAVRGGSPGTVVGGGMPMAGGGPLQAWLPAARAPRPGTTRRSKTRPAIGMSGTCPGGCSACWLKATGVAP